MSIFHVMLHVRIIKWLSDNNNNNNRLWAGDYKFFVVGLGLMKRESSFVET